ncbi:hypothetical protein JEQ12_014478 [Ovis aries]|uniref:Submaxillary mucin-like protein n=1 Tax=Ovis aries TaxID=9940 RepID=A0A836A7Z7_SHEEP|nr:hypothetical protein JEQ12_014478 [Ovis aries]
MTRTTVTSAVALRTSGLSSGEKETSVTESRTSGPSIEGSQTTGTAGTSGKFSKATISGSSHTESTTSLGERRTTRIGIITGATTGTSERSSPGSKTGNTGAISGTTVAPGSSNTETTTSRLNSDATGRGIQTGTTGTGSGTTSSPGSFNAGTAVVSSRVTGVSESSSPGTSKEAFETTTGPGISTTETTVVATGEQETENKTACYGPLGEKKSPGDIWTANCHKCTCTDAETVDCKLKECPSPPTCKPEERLVKFKDNDTCCEIGYCEPRTCLFNNNDYEVGASFADPNNPCISYSCHNTGFFAVVQDCPKQTWCAEEDRVYDSTKCCYTCKPNCRSSSVNVTVNYNGCKKKVEMARCTGECRKTIKYDYDIFQLKNSCLCCQEENYEYREIDLDCPDGGTIPYRF